MELVDGEEKDFDIPLFTCSNSLRLSQNYITEENFREIPDTDIEEIGRVRFKGRFSPGTDTEHIRFASDNDLRETIEVWEACYAEGVRQTEVLTEVPPLIQKLHDESLTDGRDILAQADAKEKEKWLAKDGTDWTGAFGKDPADLAAMKDKAGNRTSEEDDSFEQDEDDSDDPDLGLNDANHGEEDGGDRSRASQDTDGQSLATQGAESSRKSGGPMGAYKDYKSRSRDLHRKHRGLMQWRPMRNAMFAKNEALFAMRKVRTLGALDGRKSDVETEV
jgi:hypothetical protein